LKRKLNDAIGACKTSISEERVLYIMVGIRKLLEDEHLCRKYRVLKFYCDWVAHTKLDRVGAGNFLKQIDDIIGEMKNGAQRRRFRTEC